MLHIGAGSSQEASSGGHADLARWASGSIPSKRSKLQVQRLSSDFRVATRIVAEPLPAPNSIPPGHILVRRAYAGTAAHPDVQNSQLTQSTANHVVSINPRVSPAS